MDPDLALHCFQKNFEKVVCLLGLMGYISNSNGWIQHNSVHKSGIAIKVCSSRALGCKYD